jgi:virginiamycin B lyase
MRGWRLPIPPSSVLHGWEIAMGTDPRLSVRLRPRLLLAGVAGAVLAPAGVVAQDGEAERETPPEACLSLETFPVPAGEHPHDVAPAADGSRVWYTAQHTGALGLLDPETGGIETVPLGPGSAPHGVIVGPDGDAWATDGGLNAIVRVDAETFEVTSWPLDWSNANLNTAVFDADGVLWYTGQNGIVGRVDPANDPPGEPILPVEAPRGRGPYGITATPEGDVYFVSLAGSYLGKIEPEGESFRIVELDPPTPGAGTRRVWSDSSGVLWVSEWEAGQVGRYDPESGEWQEWRLPGDAPQAYAVYVDERDDVWLSDFGANALVRFDPDTEEFVSLPLPDAGAAVRQILGRPNEVWGAMSGVDKLVVVRCT